MSLTIERFDVDETPRVRNTARRTPIGATLPVDFPFLVDEESGEIVEPVLLHMAHKFWGHDAVKGGRWRYRQSADAAANDLKDWWDHLEVRGVSWNNVSDRELANYLKGLRETISGHTGDFLADATFARRCSSLETFHVFATGRWPAFRFPSMSRGAIIAGVSGRGPRSHRSEGDPHPLPPAAVNLIAAQLGPLPSEREAGESSRSRLAFELGLNAGLRVDEITKLRADIIEQMSASGADDDPVDLKITLSKGLVGRTVFLPTWLVREAKLYIGGERAESVAAARERWLKAPHREPPNLLLNRPDAPLDCGKQTSTDTIDKAFHAACLASGLTTEKVIAEGSSEEAHQTVPRHVFHDTRHTYAYWTYLGLIEQDDDERMRREPWLFIQSRLGHADVATTIGTYLKVFDELGDKVLASLGRYFRNARTLLAADRETER